MINETELLVGEPLICDGIELPLNTGKKNRLGSEGTR